MLKKIFYKILTNIAECILCLFFAGLVLGVMLIIFWGAAVFGQYIGGITGSDIIGIFVGMLWIVITGSIVGVLDQKL